MPFTCLICSATAFREVRRRSADGEPELYRCSGCGVVFSDPSSWRKMQTHEAVLPPAPRPVDETEAVVRGVFGPPVGNLMGDFAPKITEDDLREIREAAARANLSKRKR